MKSSERTFRIQEFFVIIWLVIVIVIFLSMDFAPFLEHLSTLLKFLLSCNAASFLLYSFDKLQAVTKRKRIPELVLYLSAFLGGPIGALLAMQIMRHKTRKLSFQLVLGILILIELGIGYLIYASS